VAQFLDRQRTPENYWRAVILFGQNVASYKFALAKSLIELSAHQGQTVKLEQLAEPFSRHIVEHLAQAPKQVTSASSRFLESCQKFTDGKIGRDELIGQTARLGFNNVSDAFHVVKGCSWQNGNGHKSIPDIRKMQASNAYALVGRGSFGYLKCNRHSPSTPGKGRCL
jgi:hypothetical protein